MTIYNADNTVLSDYNGVTMTEISTTGIYEYDVTATSSWGTGDFTVVCAESTKNSKDSMVLTVKALYVAGGGVEESLDALGYAVTKVYSRSGTIMDVLGKSTDTETSKTVFGMINDVETTIDNLGLATVATDARGARNQATLAYEAVNSITSQVNDMGAQIKALQKLTNYVNELKADMARISHGLSERAPAVVVPLELAGGAGGPAGGAAAGPAAGPAGGAAAGPAAGPAGGAVAKSEEINALNNKIEELNALVKILSTLIEKGNEKPVVEGWFESE